MTPKHVRILLIFIAITAAVAGVTAKLSPVRSISQTPSGVKCDKVCLQAKVDRHLVLMGEFGNDDVLQSSLKDLIKAGPPVVRIVQDTYNHWSRPENYNPKASARPGEMRWRALHLLGSLNSAEAGPFLYEVAKKQLPDPRKSEAMFADEYRIRLRAIVGLENLKAIDELKDLHELGGALRNPTATSLFVLGVNVGGVSRVDARKALAEDTADYKDFNKGKGRPPQPKKPGRERIKPTRRPDTPLIRKQQ
ncbi:MAG: hypothetical protein ACREA9_20265 [Pyrinomonadaceae bacterium]